MRLTCFDTFWLMDLLEKSYDFFTALSKELPSSKELTQNNSTSSNIRLKLRPVMRQKQDMLDRRFV